MTVLASLPSLFTPAESRVQVSPHWYATKDGDIEGLALYLRHYSAHRYQDGRRNNPRHRSRYLFVGPGEKMVLIGPDARSLFVWRKFIDDAGQAGVNCAVFRNESGERSSDLIREAVAVARSRWPGERLYTYVDPSKIRSARRKRRGVPDPRPGHCFLMAGWRTVTKDGCPLLTGTGLHILEYC